MAESNFVDYVKIYCRSGKGGRGSSHFRRAKYIPKGGPDGGNGIFRKVVPTEVTEEEEAMSICAAIGTIGRCST